LETLTKKACSIDPAEIAVRAVIVLADLSGWVDEGVRRVLTMT